MSAYRITRIWRRKITERWKIYPQWTSLWFWLSSISPSRSNYSVVRNICKRENRFLHDRHFSAGLISRLQLRHYFEGKSHVIARLIEFPYRFHIDIAALRLIIFHELWMAKLSGNLLSEKWSWIPSSRNTPGTERVESFNSLPSSLEVRRK